MGARQTIWRAARLCLALLAACTVCLALLAACTSSRKRSAPQEPHERIRLPPPAASEGARDVSVSAAAIAQVLRLVHEQKLAITPPNIQPERLAFGRGRLLQAAANEVVLWDTQRGAPVAQAKLEGVRAVASGSDGALFAVGLSGGVRFEAASSTPRRFSHVTFFASSSLFPDLEQPSYFYVYESGSQQLYRYSFAAEGGTLLPFDANFTLDGCTAAVSLLRDGAFVCRSAKGIARRVPRGIPHVFALPDGVGEPSRLLPAKRFDELFSVSRGGQVSQLRLASGSPLLGRFQLPAPAFAAVGNGEALAFVLVDPPAPGQSRRWRLLVTDLAGKPRLTVELSETSASASEDWTEAVIEDKNLAISSLEPLVAVGGAEHFWVWDYAQGLQAFAH